MNLRMTALFCSVDMPDSPFEKWLGMWVTMRNKMAHGLANTPHSTVGALVAILRDWTEMAISPNVAAIALPGGDRHRYSGRGISSVTWSFHLLNARAAKLTLAMR